MLTVCHYTFVIFNMQDFSSKKIKKNKMKQCDYSLIYLS